VVSKKPFSKKIFLLLAQIRNLQHRLTKVLSAQHTQEPINSTINALGNTELSLESALREPLLELLLVVLVVPGAHVCVSDDEAAHGNSLGDDLHEVADRVDVFGLGVVLADHAAGDDATKVLHGVDGGFELFAADVLVVDVDAVRSEACERVGGLLGLVVEASVEAELRGDEVCR
jgi:hypothetical protein